MKKLLTILGAVGLMATTGATVVACSEPAKEGEKGDFEITSPKTELKVLETVVIKVEGYTELKDKYEAFEGKIVDGDDEKPVVTIISFDANKGELTVAASLPGKAKIQIVAKPKPETPETFDDEKPFKSNIIEITVKKLPLSDVFKDVEKDLGEKPTDEEALTAVTALIPEPFKKMVEAKKVENESKIKVTVLEEGKLLLEGEVTFTYTLPEA